MKRLMHALPVILAIVGCTTVSSDLKAGQVDPVVFNLVTEKAKEHRVPVKLAHAVVTVESMYNPKVRGRRGEYGLGQILCSTARGIGFNGKCEELADAATNLRWTMSYLRMALDKAKNNECHAATLYAAGLDRQPGNSSYCRNVLRKMTVL